jgi:glycosyltransferase involved in cell wall biosynthesis
MSTSSFGANIRIGLYLRSVPGDGGVFQYGLSMLRAFASLPRDRFTPVVVYTNEKLGDYATAYDLEHHQVTRSTRLEHALGIISSLAIAAGMPSRAVQSVGERTDPFVRYLRNLQCDYWVFPTGDPLIYRSHFRSIATIHDLMHRYEPRFPEVGRFPVRWRRELHYRALCKTARLILVDSALGVTHVQESYGVERERIAILPYAVPDYMEEEGGRDPSFESTLAKLPAQYLYYPAQFWPHKNHLNLARAVHRCLQRGVPISIVLAGGRAGTHREFTQLIKELGIDHLFIEVGYVPNAWVPEMYRRSLGLIYPTYFGPTNIPPLEAMICERPMAVSDNYAMREQLGGAALYFDPDNVESMANAMIELVTNPEVHAQLVECGKGMVHRFRPATFSSRLREILEESIL